MINARFLNPMLAALILFGSGVSAYADVLPIGTVSTPVSITCKGAATNAKCVKVVVSCPNTDDITVDVADALPTGTPVGTVLLQSGGSGFGYFKGSPGYDFSSAYLAKQFEVVQTSWQSPWEDTGADHAGSPLVAACRPATIQYWVRNTYHKGGTSAPYCESGHSAGSGQVLYGLAHYGTGGIFDAVMVSAASALADFLESCTAPPNTRVEVCPGNLGGVTFAPSTSRKLDFPDSYSHTTSCENNPSVSDIAVWSASSVVSGSPTYSYPQTPISVYQCPNFNLAPGPGTFFFPNVTSTISSEKCATCSSEEYWDGSQTRFNEMVDQIMADCQPHHMPM